MFAALGKTITSLLLTLSSSAWHMPAPISHHHFQCHIQINFLFPPPLCVCVFACVCVWSVLLWMHMCARACAVPKETDRHTSMKSTKPSLIPPVIYGSQIHVMLRLNKRSFVTDSSLWSGWIGFAVSLPHRICPSLLLQLQGFLLIHTHTCTG